MSDAATLQDRALTQVMPPLACSLRPGKRANATSPFGLLGEFELQNCTAATIEISHRMTALQFLDLIVTTADGRRVSAGHFGDRFAPTLEPAILPLAPGERFTASVPLFANVPREAVKPGDYRIQAVYEYNGYRAESATLTVTV